MSGSVPRSLARRAVSRRTWVLAALAVARCSAASAASCSPSRASSASWPSSAARSARWASSRSAASTVAARSALAAATSALMVRPVCRPARSVSSARRGRQRCQVLPGADQCLVRVERLLLRPLVGQLADRAVVGRRRCRVLDAAAHRTRCPVDQHRGQLRRDARQPALAEGEPLLLEVRAPLSCRSATVARATRDLGLEPALGHDRPPGALDVLEDGLGRWSPGRGRACPVDPGRGRRTPLGRLHCLRPGRAGRAVGCARLLGGRAVPGLLLGQLFGDLAGVGQPAQLLAVLGQRASRGPAAPRRTARPAPIARACSRVAIAAASSVSSRAVAVSRGSSGAARRARASWVRRCSWSGFGQHQRGRLLGEGGQPGPPSGQVTGRDDGAGCRLGLRSGQLRLLGGLVGQPDRLVGQCAQPGGRAARRAGDLAGDLRAGGLHVGEPRSWGPGRWSAGPRARRPGPAARRCGYAPRRRPGRAPGAARPARSRRRRTAGWRRAARAAAAGLGVRAQEGRELALRQQHDLGELVQPHAEQVLEQLAGLVGPGGHRLPARRRPARAGPPSPSPGSCRRRASWAAATRGSG